MAYALVSCKSIVDVRLYMEELARIDAFAKSSGVLSRSRLANIALQSFLEAHSDDLSRLVSMRRVRLVLDFDLAERTNELAERLGVPRVRLIRLALKEFASGSLTI